MTYRIFINHEDPKSYNDGEKIVVNESVPTLRDVRRLLVLVGSQVLDPELCKQCCMLTEAIKEGSRRAVLAHENFPVTLLYDTISITLYEKDEAVQPMDNKWCANESLVKALKHLLEKYEKSRQ